MPTTSSDNTKMSNSASVKKTATAKKSETKVTPVSASVPTSSLAGSVVVSPTKASKASVSSASVAVSSPAPASVIASVAVVESVVAPVVDAGEESVVASFATLLTKFTDLRSKLNELAPEMKKMEKQVARLEKKAEKRRRRKTGVDGEKKANPTSVFTVPVKITDDLCVFLGIPKGTQVSRSDVTRGVMRYAKEHSLTDKQQIKPDATLRKLLAISESDELTILNLQKYLKTHYIKAVPVVVAA